MEQLLPSPGLCSLMSGAGEVWRDSQVSSCTPWTGLQSWFLWPNPVLGKAAQLPQLPTLLKNSCNTLGMWTKLTEGVNAVRASLNKSCNPTAHAWKQI